MNEEIKRKLINSCNIISNENKNLSHVRENILVAADICTTDVISINGMNMKDSIQSLSMDVDRISEETKKFIEDTNEEIMVMSRVV